MRVGTLLLIQAALFITLATLSTALWARVLWLWFASAFALTGVVYLLDRPALLMKRPERGTMHPASYLIFAPMHALVGVVGNLIRALSGEKPADEVAPDLWLGRLLSSRELRDLPRFTGGVLDLTSELPEHPELRALPGYLCRPVLDTHGPTQADLRAGVDHIRDALSRGPCFVHCAMGHGRSSTLIVAWMLEEGRADSIDTAEASLQAIRPGVRLTRSQRRALRTFTAPTP